MKKGIVIVNGYLRSKKFDEITQMYVAAARKNEMVLQVLSTKALCYGIVADTLQVQGIEKEAIDFVLFLDKDIHLAEQLEAMGLRVFNPANVIACCDDKATTFLRLSGQGIQMPKTIIAPLIFKGTYEGVDEAYTKELEITLGYPMVVKECCGSFGEQVYLVHNRQELQEKQQALVGIPHLYQQCITSSIGKDIRIHVVGEEVVASMYRQSTSDFRANISSGGQMQCYTPDARYTQMAKQVAKVLGADFLGVDILIGPDGAPILCEVNSNAHIKNIYECTGVNVAEAIMAYIRKELV